MKKTMRKYLKKPTVRKPVQAVNWNALKRNALERAEVNDINVEDPRLRMLRACQGQPERTLRRLSILTPTDIDREFGAKPD
jgi:hypothetical protein